MWCKEQSSKTRCSPVDVFFSTYLCMQACCFIQGFPLIFPTSSVTLQEEMSRVIGKAGKFSQILLLILSLLATSVQRCILFAL